jgi:hypothetical protein
MSIGYNNCRKRDNCSNVRAVAIAVRELVGVQAVDVDVDVRDVDARAVAIDGRVLVRVQDVDVDVDARVRIQVRVVVVRVQGFKVQVEVQDVQVRDFIVAQEKKAKQRDQVIWGYTLSPSRSPRCPSPRLYCCPRKESKAKRPSYLGI